LVLQRKLISPARGAPPLLHRRGEESRKVPIPLRRLGDHLVEEVGASSPSSLWGHALLDGDAEPDFRAVKI
jgi:hypothetical protein